MSGAEMSGAEMSSAESAAPKRTRPIYESYRREMDNKNISTTAKKGTGVFEKMYLRHAADKGAGP